MNKWSVVGTRPFIDEIQKSNYFSKDLGKSFMNDDNSNKSLRDNSFTTWYYKKTNALIFKQGTIGNINFYIDYYLQKPIIGFFLESKEDTHQYAIDLDVDDIKQKGVDVWLGENLQQLDNQVSYEKQKTTQKEGIENLDEGDPDMVLKNPGEASWKDIQAYYKKYKK